MPPGPLTSLLVTGDDTLRIEPPRASLGQLQLTNRLEMIRVDPEVSQVAEDLKSIDTGLVLLHDKKQNIFVLYHEGFNEKREWVENFVGAYTELDDRIVNLIRRIDNQGRGRYDLGRELDRLEKQKDREAEAAHSEQMGPLAERLRWALRKDLGATGSSVQMSAGPGIYRNRAERRAAGRRGTR